MTCPTYHQALDQLAEALGTLTNAERCTLKHDLLERAATDILEYYGVEPRAARDAHPPDLTTTEHNIGTSEQQLQSQAPATNLIQ